MIEEQSSVIGRHILVLPALRAEEKIVKDTKKERKQESDSLVIRKGYSWIQKACLDGQFISFTASICCSGDSQSF